MDYNRTPMKGNKLMFENTTRVALTVVTVVIPQAILSVPIALGKQADKLSYKIFKL